MILLGDFNAKSKSWSVSDTSTEEGKALENLNGVKQVISVPTHISLHFSSCIELIFVKLPSLVTDSGINPSLHHT